MSRNQEEGKMYELYVPGQSASGVSGPVATVVAWVSGVIVAVLLGALVRALVQSRRHRFRLANPALLWSDEQVSAALADLERSAMMDW